MTDAIGRESETMDARGARLDGKVAVVTGGTQGLGEAIARLFAERGMAVVSELSGIGSRAEYVRADLAELNQARAVMATADQAFGRVDVLVNAAGITDRGTVLDTAPELFERMMAVNLRAPFFLIQDAARIMRRERIAGTIVNIQSMSALGGQPFLAPYSVSKGALATLTKNAAFALMPWRIRVNGLNLGWMNTPGEDRIMRLHHGATDGWLEKAAAEQPFGRLIDPHEAARAVAFLVSDESGMMTGVNVDYDQTVPGCWEQAPHPSPLG
jgi:NAD(P)-dependent dehydrogenase (short-subunit alcohol dehydrogenase family)